jgi:hypothetical protein
MDPSGHNAMLEIAIPFPFTWKEAVVAFAISVSAVCVLEAAYSLLQNEIVGLNGGFDFTLVKVPNCFFATRKSNDRWTCKGQCDVVDYSHGGNTTLGPIATGSGSSQTAACQAATDAAKALTPQGSYPRHCDCFDCEKR